MVSRAGSLKLSGAIFMALMVAGRVCWGIAAEGQGPAPRAKLAFAAAGKESVRLRFEEFRFDTGVLTGTLRRAGRSLGLTPVADKATGKPLGKASGLFSHYRLLSAGSRYGTAAWDWPSTARLLDDGAVEVRWAADAKHPLDMTAVYRWKRPNALDLTTTVTARKPVRGLEVFLASYFQGFPESLVYVRQGREGKPAFLAAKRSAGHWQMFPRDEQAVRTVTDGRWKRPPHPVDWKIMPFLAAPLALRRDADSGLTAVVMARCEDCFAVATPYGQEGHRSLYLSLLGRDLKAGESATARSRLVIGRGISDQQAVALYEAYTKELAEADKAEK